MRLQKREFPFPIPNGWFAVAYSDEISVGQVKVQKFSEFVRNLVVPTNLNIVQVKPLRGACLFVLDPSLVFSVIDNLFGGDGRFPTTSVPRRKRHNWSGGQSEACPRRPKIRWARCEGRLCPPYGPARVDGHWPPRQ